MRHQFVFISGLHRSGTSVLHEILKSQNDISGFSNTGAPEDEGQHLQTVYENAEFYGGPGKFALNSEAHYTETSRFIFDEGKAKLMQEWGKYWDFSKTILIEKSPPNLIRTRFLQYLFPDSKFITIIRHPIAVGYATKYWTKQPLKELMEHWLKAHQIYFDDVKYIKHHLEVKYEDLIHQPEKELAKIGTFLGCSITYNNQLEDGNAKYFKKWQKASYNPLKAFEKRALINTFEKDANTFGYSLKDIAKNKKITNL